MGENKDERGEESKGITLARLESNKQSSVAARLRLANEYQWKIA